jgi:hypothetical protein
MKFPLMQSLTAFLLTALLSAPAPAQTSGSKHSPSALRAVVVPGATLFLDGSRLLFRTTDNAYSNYQYHQGRLSKIRHSDGRLTTYHYEDGKLDRIEFSDGRVQKAVYAGGELALIEGASGQRLGLAPNADRADKVVASALGKDGRVQSKQKAPRAIEQATPERRTKALNAKLIAIENWETNDWECTFNPEGEQVCTGRGGNGDIDDPGYPGDGWGPGDSPGDADPGGGGSGGSGGGSPIRPDLPTRESCYQAAYNTWVIMRDTICPMVRNQQSCLQGNYQLFQDLRVVCEVTYP